MLKELLADDSVGKYITSDLHFYHQNILKWASKTRPFKDVDHMNESLIAEWNSVVGENDVVFFLGDFSFNGRTATAKILERLNGYKVMLLGNHDKKLRSLYEQYFDEVHDYLEITYKKTKICMMHFPISCWNRAAHGSIMLHGHTHGNFQGVGRTVDVGYDNYGKIMQLDEVVKQMAKKPIEVLDHHGSDR